MATPQTIEPETYSWRSTPTALRVLHVIAPAPIGGLERVVCTLVPGLLDAGVDVRVAAVLDRDTREHPVVAELRDSGVRVETTNLPSRAYGKERRWIRELCASWPADVVHTHGYRCDLVDSAVTRALSIPHVSTFHGFTGGDVRNRAYEWLDRRVARRMDAVIAVSQSVSDRLAAAGVSRERLRVVPNAHRARPDFATRSAARAELGLPDNQFIVAWVGRLTKEKGADVLLDAIPYLGSEHVAVSFIGEGKEKQSLVARAATRAPGRVRWHGAVPDAARLLRAFDCLVLSSRTEGTPMVLLEAMDAGIPIVATRVGGVPDVLREGNALVVDPENPSVLAAAIREIIANPAAAYSRSHSARARLATDYGVGAWIERHKSIYQDVTHGSLTQ